MAGLAVGVLWMPSVSHAQIAAPFSSPSDPRAQFVAGNVVTCSGAGIVSTPGTHIIQVGAPENNPASDINLSGVVTPHAGGGEELSVTIAPTANVVIDGVIVKGGDGYNLYTNPAVLPPALAPANQHYIAPLNGGGNIPVLSHWFVCYHETAPRPTGTLAVTKSVIVPNGIPVTPLPTTFVALVNCNDNNPAHQNVLITFGLGGGRSATPDLVGIPLGTVCTVVEQTGNAPTVTYTPVGANSPGVTINDPTEGVVVDITNDFSTVAVQRGTLHFEKVLVPAPGIEPPPNFTVHVACDDGTTGPVTLPGTGGAGTPDLSVRSDSLCALIEDISSLPGGWTLTYSVNGGPPSATPPIIPIRDDSTVTVTITNDATAVEPPVPTTTTSTTTTIAATTTTIAGGGPAGPTTTIGGGSGVLPPTGGVSDKTVGLAFALVAVGTALAVGLAQRRSDAR